MAVRLGTRMVCRAANGVNKRKQHGQGRETEGTQATQTDQETQEEQEKMSRDTFADRVYELSVTAGMNQRYHQRQQLWWWKWDTGAKIVTAIFAVIGLALSIVTTAIISPAANGWGIFVSLIAAISAVVLNVVPFGAWESTSADLFRRWTDIREEVDSLEFDLGTDDPSTELIHALRNLEAKANRICGCETLPNRDLLDECLVQEEVSRGVQREESRQ